MDVNGPNDVEMPNTGPVNPLEEIIAPPAPQLIRQVINQNELMAPNQPAQGHLGLVFNPNPHAPRGPQGPIGGRRHKSRRHKSHRRKSHRRKSHRR